MSYTILNIGDRETEEFYRPVADTSEQHASVHTLDDLNQAYAWASLYQPDAVVVDLRKYNAGGIDFLQRFRNNPTCGDIPVLAIVSESDRERRALALRAGANDLLMAPLDRDECRCRLANTLTVGTQRRIIRHQAKWLEKGSGDVSHEIHARERETLLRLARAGEYRDESTGSHIFRIAKVSRSIAEQLGLPESECDVIEAAAPMHDIGKIGISDSILRKPGPLTEAEREVMETHTLIGYEILKESRSIFLQRGAEIALGHHEKFDGSGYPHGRRGGEIPLAARIVAVADVYDALTSRRPYKAVWSHDKVLAYLHEQKARHFDPQCVDAFFAQTKAAIVNF